MGAVYVLKSEAFLVTSLVERLACAFAVTALEPADFVDTYLMYVLSEGSGDSEKVSFILDTSNKNVTDSITRLSEKSLIRRFPKVVVVSSLSSYGGGMFSKSNAANVLAPFANFRTNYVAEQAFLGLAELTGMDVTVVSAGLLYGSSGLDFEDLFGFMASEQFSSPSNSAGTDGMSMPSLSEGLDNVPIVHVDDYAAVVRSCVERESARSAEARRIFVAEKSVLKLADIFDKLAAAFDRSAALCVGYARTADIILSQRDCQLLWSTNWTSGDTITAPSSFADKLPAVIDEYLVSRHMQPCALAVIGKPFCGKSSLARSLSRGLGIECVDTGAALAYVLASREGVSGEVDLRRSELIEAVKGSKADEKKGAKKGEEPPLDVTSVVFNDTLVRAIPKELQVGCLKIYLSSSKPCKFKGFVLDVWRHGVVATVEDLSSICKVELIVELTQPEPSLKKRYAEAQGITDDPKAKVSKEQAGALKDFEESLALYSDQSGVDAAPVELVRYDLDESDEGAVASGSIANFIKVHGPVGWIKGSEQGAAEAVSAGGEQAVGGGAAASPGADNAALDFAEDLRIRKYLDLNVSRALSEINIACRQQRCEDPIGFLARELSEQSKAAMSTAQSRNEELLKAVLQN